MFCVLPLLVLSGVSLETAANFLLFLSVAIFLEEGKLVSDEDWISLSWLVSFLSLRFQVSIIQKSVLILKSNIKQSQYS